jgi:hypothetical protein
MALCDATRQLATCVPSRKGAYPAGDTSAGRQECKITCPPCKTPVLTPSGWGEPGGGDAVLERSSRVPQRRLPLEFAYGYDGMANTSANVFYNCQHQVCTGSAAAPHQVRSPSSGTTLKTT